MPRGFVFVCLLLTCLLTASARAEQSPTYSGPLSPAEKSFVHAIQSDLNQRFQHASDAERAGYIRYTGVDETGAISYANMQWHSTDIQHPSQLWYDKNGNLLGADFSVPDKARKRPHVFGINPGRWYLFDDHIHYVVKDARSGRMKYDLAVGAKQFAAAGGDLRHPTAATLVKMRKVKAAGDVATIFDFPALWDLIVWVKPNPSGAFAEKNPAVKP